MGELAGEDDPEPVADFPGIPVINPPVVVVAGTVPTVDAADADVEDEDDGDAAET